MTKLKNENSDPNNEKGAMTIAELDAVNGGTGSTPAQTTLSNAQNKRHETLKTIAQNLRG